MEIFTHGQWMAVCDDGFDDNAAKVRQNCFIMMKIRTHGMTLEGSGYTII